MSDVGEETKYVIGDLVKLTARFQDPVTLQFVQPTTVTCEVKDPDGVPTTPTPSFDANLTTPDRVTGKGFFVEIDAEKAGTWYYRFAVPPGITYQAADEDSFFVERSAFG